MKTAEDALRKLKNLEKCIKNWEECEQRQLKCYFN